MEKEQNILEHENMKTNNNSKTTTMIIVILSIIIVGLISFICYDKLIRQENINQNNNNQEENNKIENENKDNENKDNENKDNENKDNENIEIEPVALEKNELDTLTKSITPIFEYTMLQKSIPLSSVHDIQNKDLLLYAASVLTNEKSSFTKNEVEQLIKKVFGEEIKVTHEDIPCGVNHSEVHKLGNILYIYNNATGTYTYNSKHIGHGGDGGANTYDKYIDSYKVNNTYTVKYKIIYSEICSDICWHSTYYTSLNDSKNKKNPVYVLNYDLDELGMSEEIFKKIEDKVPVTTFTYEKNNNGTYNLKSITVE